MTILTTVILCGLFMALVAAVERGRALNLEYRLDDAQRNAAYWQQRTDALLCENSTLAVDLIHSERHAAYCRSHKQHKRDIAAGFILVTGLARSERKMHAWTVGAP